MKKKDSIFRNITVQINILLLALAGRTWTTFNKYRV